MDPKSYQMVNRSSKPSRDGQRIIRVFDPARPRRTPSRFNRTDCKWLGWIDTSIKCTMMRNKITSFTETKTFFKALSRAEPSIDQPRGHRHRRLRLLSLSLSHDTRFLNRPLIRLQDLTKHRCRNEDHFFQGENRILTA